MLNPVFAECHLVSVVELSCYSQRGKACEYDYYQQADIPHSIVSL